MSALDRQLLIRCSSRQRERWTAAAQAAGVSLSVWARNALDDTAAVEETIRRNEERERQVSAELHALDPTLARARDWDRTTEGRGHS